MLGENTEERQTATGIPFFVDPRVVRGTSWVTGANEHGKHVANLVYGRDFSADGTLEACEVREGDPAPDGCLFNCFFFKTAKKYRFTCLMYFL